MTIEEYCSVINVELVCTMLKPGVWHAKAKSVEVMDRGALRSEFGAGETPEKALRDYAKQIAGRRIAINAMSSTRREFDVPENVQ